MNRIKEINTTIKLDFLKLSLAEEKFVDIKVKLYEILIILQKEYPQIYVESNIDTIDSIIYNICKFPIIIDEIGALLVFN